MTEDQIPDFVDDVLATGSPICAIGDDLYVLGELDVPEEDMERVSREVHAISLRYGERDHLRREICAYLYSVGRFYDLKQETYH
ncbi:hypothetical protein [Rhizobium rhizogenes]|uniref:Uncharacterized protein n=1 Tax=Rhizobium rhizogenes TaxID=359 RepID=A0AA92BYX4_RHIRH|nr:hypothetical protein [Rhizobium rhizogenes]PVE49895.1 hypothetical protein DC430_23645 [Rhizobium rhizogenes]PVE62013.1 hypothetical protein DC415_24000 [Agrobacterium tumefaciens]PVE69777.1 hypothetical protein DCP16_24000 [Sphingomonas sp. TPD3009]